MGNRRIIIPVILTSILVLAVIAILSPEAVAAPNENANERAKGGMPENVVEIAPGIYSLGKYKVDDTMIEGFLVLHHRPGHEGGPGDGEVPPDDPPESTCFSFLAENNKWKRPESWLLNSVDKNGVFVPEVLPILSDSITDWEDEAGKNILGNGQETTDELFIDLAFPTDGVNEVYFTNIFDLTGTEGIIAATGVWIRTPPVGDKTIIEWDQIYDDVHFDWNFDASDESPPENEMDFKNIAMHELGHAMGMGHPPRLNECVNETMYFQADTGEIIKRDLAAGDIVGIQTLY